MVNRPSVPEIITVNSETLQSLVRDLLPSQNGFGSELQATNVITPIIDLTATAEGSTLRSDLQTAIAFGSQTVFATANTTDDIATSPGFYRIIGTSTISTSSGASQTKLIMTDGASPINVWRHVSSSSSGMTVNLDIIFWLAAGITLQTSTSATTARLDGSIRQIADSTGAFVNPSGFPL